jgi:hypothetical protein
LRDFWRLRSRPKAVRDANGLTAPSGRSPRRAETIGWLKYTRIVLEKTDRRPVGA